MFNMRKSDYILLKHMRESGAESLAACICDYYALCWEDKLNIQTQANPVSAGVNRFSYDDGWSHDDSGYEDTDDRSCVGRGGCRDKTRWQEKIVKQ